MEWYVILNIVFYVPSMLAVLLMTMIILRTVNTNMNICLINLTVTTVAELIRITAFVLHRRHPPRAEDIPAGLAAVEHVIHMSHLYALLLYFGEQTYCMKHTFGRFKISTKAEAIALSAVWIFVLAVSLTAFFLGYKDPNQSNMGRFIGVYLDEVGTYRIGDMRTEAISGIIQGVFYKAVPILGLGIISIVAYRRWYSITQTSYLSARCDFKPTRGQHDLFTAGVPPRGIEMQRIDDNKDRHHVTITPSDSTSRFDGMIRKYSVAWFCSATYALLSLMILAIWGLFDDATPFANHVVDNFLVSVRFFAYLGTLSAAYTHDFYLHRNKLRY